MRMSAGARKRTTWRYGVEDPALVSRDCGPVPAYTPGGQRAARGMLTAQHGQRLGVTRSGASHDDVGHGRLGNRAVAATPLVDHSPQPHVAVRGAIDPASSPRTTGCPSRIQKSSPPSSSFTRSPDAASL
jgi:hypothetical protein